MSLLSLRRAKKGPREVQAAQPHLRHWEGDGAATHRNLFQVHKQQENYQDQSARTDQGEVVIDQLDHLQWWEVRKCEGRAIDVVYLDFSTYFSKAFHPISHKMLVEKLMKYEVAGQAVR